MYVVYQPPTKTDICQKPLMIAAFLTRADAVTFVNSQMFTGRYEVIELVNGWSDWCGLRTKTENAVAAEAQ
jgi:hypothetical protein